MKTYRGDRTIDGLEVTVDGQPLDPRFDLKTFSENGFEWSYAGSEPRQLALALLADCCDDQTALQLNELFMKQVVAEFENEWQITEQSIRSAVETIR